VRDLYQMRKEVKMKRYRAIVIDGKKIVRCSLQVGILILVACLIAVNINIAGVNWNFGSKLFDNERIIRESLPVIQGGKADDTEENTTRFGIKDIFKKAVSFTLGFDPHDERTIIFGQIPLVRTVSGSYLAVQANAKIEPVYNPQNADLGQGAAEPVTPNEGEYPIKDVDSSQAKTYGKDSGKILIRNETDYGVNIEEMLSSSLGFNMSGSSPKVLIVHTHATESYAPEGAQTYQADKSDRSLDTTQNVVRVGTAIKEVFEKKGIGVIHDTTLHDHPNFNGSYENARKTIEKYLSKNPEICIVLDIHRDAFVYDDGSKAKFVSEIDGKKTAQLMLVVGSSGGGLEHPNWRENMKFAIKLQNHISKKYPTLMRGINLRNERFNGHLTSGSLIIEVGSSGNTLEESILGATLGAEQIADFLKSLTKTTG